MLIPTGEHFKHLQVRVFYVNTINSVSKNCKCFHFKNSKLLANMYQEKESIVLNNNLCLSNTAFMVSIITFEARLFR